MLLMVNKMGEITIEHIRLMERCGCEGCKEEAEMMREELCKEGSKVINVDKKGWWINEAVYSGMWRRDYS